MIKSLTPKRYKGHLCYLGKTIKTRGQSCTNNYLENHSGLGISMETCEYCGKKFNLDNGTCCDPFDYEER